MKTSIKILSLLSLNSLFIACGNPAEVPESKAKIINGQPLATYDLAPQSTVSVSSPGGRCTGVIIGPRHVLTASHCLPQENKTTVQLYEGSLPRADLVYQVDRVRMRLGVRPEVNDFYDDTNAMADIAVLRIVGTFPAPYEAVELAPTYPGSGVSGFSIGKGRHNDADNPTQEMLWANTMTASFSDFGGFFNTYGQTTDSGDSGGPFFTTSDTTGKLRLIGTLNGGAGIGNVGTEVYTSTAYFRTWISAQILAL